MPHDHADRFFVLFAAGLGLFLVGGANLCLRGWSARVRAAASALVLAVVLGGFALGRADAELLSRLAILLFGGVLGCMLLSSRPVLLLCSALLRSLSIPGVCWLQLGVCGLLIVAVSVRLYDIEDDGAITLPSEYYEWEAHRPPLAPAENAHATTDLGTPIPLKAPSSPRTTAEAGGPEQLYLVKSSHRDHLIRRGSADDHANCHGWVFTGGRYWVTGASVEQILAENAYRVVSVPRPGDLAIYRKDGVANHTAAVRYVTPGMPVLVEGKWGPLGVYLHPVEQSDFGTDITYYRSRRTSHLLCGLPDGANDRTSDQVRVE